MTLNRKFVFLATLVIVALSALIDAGEKAQKKNPPPPPPPIEEWVPVGKGGYVVQAKDKLPAQPFVTDKIKGPLPSNDWCTSVHWETFSSNHFAMPLAMRCDKAGLKVGYPEIKAQPTRFEYAFGEGDVIAGHSAETAFPDARLDGYSDWFIRVEFKNGEKTLQTAYGHGSPFVYVRTKGGNPRIRFIAAATAWHGKDGDSVIGVSLNGKHYALFGTPKSKWSIKDNTTFENDGPDGFVTVALLPEKDSKLVELFGEYAFNEVTESSVAWNYLEKEAAVETTYSYKTQAIVPGGKPGTLFALLPHQWLHSDPKHLLPHEYRSIRGPMKLGAGESFKTRMTFNGILPVVPSPQRSPEVTKQLNDLLTDAMAQKLDDPADSYWASKPLDQLALSIAVAEQLGNAEAKTKLLELLKGRLETWLTPPAQTNGKKERYYAYNKRWGTLTGQNTSYGSEKLNDHHFHYGYFIRAAAEVARHDPEWAKDENFGGMVRLLIRDIASADRKDAQFPFLRSFDIYEGHSWADGSAVSNAGNNQESISETINAWTGIYLWGMATNDKALRDLGAFLYTQEVAACESYWFDVEQRFFPKEYQRSCAVLVFSGSSAYATWFSGKPEHCHGILLLPIQPGSFYLGRHPAYVQRSIDNVVALVKHENLEWMEHFAQYMALIDPKKATAWFESQRAKMPPRIRPVALHWISALDALGQFDPKTTADYSAAMVFDKAGKRSYAVYNYGADPIKVTFSDGKKFDAPKGLSIQQ
jgi:endoglucanase Acf2